MARPRRDPPAMFVAVVQVLAGVVGAAAVSPAGIAG
jgi:hypothetical protein